MGCRGGKPGLQRGASDRGPPRLRPLQLSLGSSEQLEPAWAGHCGLRLARPEPAALDLPHAPVACTREEAWRCQPEAQPLEGTQSHGQGHPLPGGCGGCWASPGQLPSSRQPCCLPQRPEAKDLKRPCQRATLSWTAPGGEDRLCHHLWAPGRKRSGSLTLEANPQATAPVLPWSRLETAERNAPENSAEALGVSHCPSSAWAGSAAGWQRTRLGAWERATAGAGSPGLLPVSE